MNNNIVISNKPFNKYISYLTLLTFIALYIISFIFLFKTETEVISFILLTIFSIFFTLFIIDTLSVYISNFNTTFITGLTWFTLFTSMAFKITALVFILILFKSLNKIKNIVKLGKPSQSINNYKDIKMNIPPTYKLMLNDYKILFILNMAFILVLMAFLIYNYSSLNSEFFNNMNIFMEEATYSKFRPLILPIGMIFTCLRLLFMTSYEVYIGNEFFKLNNKTLLIT